MHKSVSLSSDPSVVKTLEFSVAPPHFCDTIKAVVFPFPMPHFYLLPTFLLLPHFLILPCHVLCLGFMARHRLCHCRVNTPKKVMVSAESISPRMSSPYLTFFILHVIYHVYHLDKTWLVCLVLHSVSEGKKWLLMVTQ